MKRKYLQYLGIALIALVIGACEKVEDGYISDHITYNLKTLEATEGQIAYSGSLILDGSTGPLEVRLLSIRDKETGREATEFLKEYEVPVYLAEITSEDNTLERLHQKIGTDKVPAIVVNEIGGRVGLTRATGDIDIKTGLYTIDVEVKNSRGMRVINNALDIRLSPPEATYEITYRAMTTSDLGVEDNFIDAGDFFEIDVQREATVDNKIIFRWVDKNGNTFNPAAGEIIRRGDRPIFTHWSPYYPEEVTDESITYQFPFTGLDYPVLRQVNVAGQPWDGGITYYRVVGAATDIGKNLNPVSTIKYLTSGTYTVTYHLNNVVRKESGS